MKRIDFYAHVCNHYAPAKQSDSDAKDPSCLALFIVYQFFLFTLFLVGAMIDMTRRCFAF